MNFRDDLCVKISKLYKSLIDFPVLPGVVFFRLQFTGTREGRRAEGAVQDVGSENSPMIQETTASRAAPFAAACFGKTR